MSRGLADTSLFIARESGRQLDTSSIPEEIAVCAITIGELRAGVLVAEDPGVRDRRLTTLIDALKLDAIPVEEPVAEAWAKLRILLHRRAKRMPLNDSWIAATAMALEVPVVTQDDDYDAASGPDLEVIKV